MIQQGAVRPVDAPNCGQQLRFFFGTTTLCTAWQRQPASPSAPLPSTTAATTDCHDTDWRPDLQNYPNSTTKNACQPGKFKMNPKKCWQVWLSYSCLRKVQLGMQQGKQFWSNGWTANAENKNHILLSVNFLLDVFWAIIIILQLFILIMLKIVCLFTLVQFVFYIFFGKIFEEIHWESEEKKKKEWNKSLFTLSSNSRYNW